MFLQFLSVMADKAMNGEFITSVVITGLVVVFVALIFLVIFIAGLGKSISALTKEKSKETYSTKNVLNTLSVNTLPVVEDGIDDEIIAVIAAAIAAISSESGSKLSIRSIRKSSNSFNAWSMAGALENTKPF